jgi:large subunit ribosomal protein L19
MGILLDFNNRQIERLTEGKKAIPVFGPGDNLTVYVRILEGKRERIQRFEGLCIARRNAGLQSTFCVRRVTGDFGLERVFHLYSPIIDHIECTRRGKVRRNKLYYVRTLSRKKSRIKERVSK